MSALIFILGGTGTAIGAVIGAYVSVRMVRPNQDRVIQQTRSLVAQDQDTLLGRWRELVEEKDDQISDQRGELDRCHTRIDDLARREEACEERAGELAHRVAHLEDVLKHAGLNGSE